MKAKHPDEEIIERHRLEMNVVASSLDQLFNYDGKKRIAFVLLVTEFGKSDGGRVNYISNGQRADVVTMMKEVLARFEGQPEVKGRA